MRAVLTLPSGATLTSGDSPAALGSIGGGTYSEATWIIVFEKNGTHTLRFDASGNDSNGLPCSASKSATIQVGKGFQPSLFNEAFYIVLVVTCLAVLLVLFVVASQRRREKKQGFKEKLS